MHDLVRTMSGLGRRLTDAGREARQASTAVGKEVIDQLTGAIGAATGEVVRAAVIGAVAAIIRCGPKTALPLVQPPMDSWEDLDDVGAERINRKPEDVADQHGLPKSSSPGRPVWVTGVRTVGAALTVAAGAAAAVPGGRLVAAGLGAVAAVAGLAARAGEVPVSE
jgi:hypothetical protein